MKILVVGGLGFLGRRCLERLSDYDVTIVGRQQQETPFRAKTHQYSQLDICDVDNVKKTLRSDDYSHLLYLAWPPSPPHNGLEHIKFSYDTIQFVKIFAEVNPLARIVVLGSIHEAELNGSMIPDSVTQFCPPTIYGLSKKYVYACLSKIFSELLPKISFCWVRLSHVYGPDDHSQRAISQLILKAKKHENLELHNPNHIVDFVHVKDAVTGIIAAFLSNFEGCINIGSGQGVRLRDVKDLINDLVKNPSQLNFDVDAKCEILKQGSILDISTASKVLKYTPEVSFIEGIRECFYTKEVKIDECN